MTEQEVADVLKAATDKLAEDMETCMAGFKPPTAEDVAEYVLQCCTGLDWSRVANMRAEFKDDGATLEIDFGYVPDPEYIIVSLKLPEEVGDENGEDQQQIS